jgi:Fe-Mn family superoxide dismutase
MKLLVYRSWSELSVISANCKTAQRKHINTYQQTIPMAHELPDLGYAYDALEPHIDARTMEIHHSKHHNAYVTNLNAALEGSDLADKSICELVMGLSEVPEGIRGAVRNHGGGHFNHAMFWKLIAPGGASEPSAPVAEGIKAAFGSMDGFKEAFTKAAMTRFGSGWAWLGVKDDGTFGVCSTANQDNPMMGEISGACGCKPILGLDVWEHAYYLNYQNRRPDYVAAFFKIINWDAVNEFYEMATSKGQGGSCD